MRLPHSFRVIPGLWFEDGLQQWIFELAVVKLKISSNFQKLLGAFGRIDKLYSLSELLQGIPSDLQEEHSCFHYPNQEVHGDALQVLPFPENNRLPNRRQSSVILRFRIDVIFLRNRSGYQGLCFVSSMISHSRNIYWVLCSWKVLNRR